MNAGLAGEGPEGDRRPVLRVQPLPHPGEPGRKEPLAGPVPLARAAGITRIAELTGLDTIGIPVFAAIRPMGKSLSTQQGKGVTPLAAKVSALMESLETFSAENLGAPRVRASAKALGARAVDVRKLARPRGRLERDAKWPWL